MWPSRSNFPQPLYTLVGLPMFQHHQCIQVETHRGSLVFYNLAYQMCLFFFWHTFLESLWLDQSELFILCSFCKTQVLSVFLSRWVAARINVWIRVNVAPPPTSIQFTPFESKDWKDKKTENVLFWLTDNIFISSTQEPVLQDVFNQVKNQTYNILVSGQTLQESKERESKGIIDFTTTAFVIAVSFYVFFPSSSF